MGQYSCINFQTWNKLLKFGEQSKDQGATDTAATSQTVSEEVDATAKSDHATCQQMLHSIVNNITDQEFQMVESRFW